MDYIVLTKEIQWCQIKSYKDAKFKLDYSFL